MDVLIFIISFITSFVFFLGGVGSAIISIAIPINAVKPIELFINTVSITGARVSTIANKRLDFKMGVRIFVFSFIFAIPGAYLSEFIPTKYILALFIAFLIFSELMFLFHKKKEVETFRTNIPYIPLSLIGILAGLLSGLLGIGGGTLIAPLMLMLCLNPKKIAAITAFVVPFSSFSGFLTYWTMGSIDCKILAIVSVAGIAGATLGTTLMQKRLSATSVKKIMAVILLVMAAKMLFKLF